MKIFITGGTGFVGRHLVSRLLGEGHTVTVLSRSEKASDRLPGGASIVIGDPVTRLSLQILPELVAHRLQLHRFYKLAGDKALLALWPYDTHLAQVIDQCLGHTLRKGPPFSYRAFHCLQGGLKAHRLHVIAYSESVRE